jgi:hypothetical protein
VTDPESTDEAALAIPVPTASELHPRLAQRGTASGALSPGTVVAGLLAAQQQLQAQMDDLNDQISKLVLADQPVPAYSTPPSVVDADPGYMYYDTADQMLMCWDGNEWEGVALLAQSPPYTGQVEDGSFLTWSSQDNTLDFISSSDVISEAGVVVLSYSFSTATTAPPSKSQVRLNALPASATKIYVDKTTDNGADATLLLRMISAGSKIGIQDKKDSGSWASYTVTANAVDSGSYFLIAVSYTGSAGTAQGNNLACLLVVQGGGGGGAGLAIPDVSYRHYQSTASNVWTITHNLGFRPNVTVVDSGGTEAIPGTVKYQSDSVVVLTFSASFGGEAYLS